MRYIIIGASAAGTQAAEDIRNRDAAGDILLIGEEPYPPYSRCLISRFVDGRLPADRLYFKTRDFASRLGIRCASGVAVTDIHPQRHEVECEDGRRHGYDKLLLATGSRPWMPRVGGVQREDVFGFHGLADAQKVAEASRTARSCAVIGAGFAGLEAAYALARRGLKVTVIERCSQILPNQLDARGARIIHEDLEAQGISLMLDESAGAIDGNGRVTGVTLTAKSHVQADLVVVAAGTEPNKTLAGAAGLSVGRGIVVDAYLRTSDPDIHAAGDAIEIEDLATGKRTPSATWFNAVLQGRYAAWNMTGTPRHYGAAVGIQNAVQFHQVPAISYGQTLVDGGTHEDYQVISRQDSPKQYKKLVLKGDRIVGMTFVGDIQKSGFYNALIRHQVDVSEVKNKLLDDDFSYALFHDREQFGQQDPYRGV